MGSPKGKPAGYFDFLFAIDVETTGLCFEPSESPVYNPATGEHHQAISWGIVIARADTLEILEELYLEVKWNKLSIEQQEDNPEFGKKAEQIHGLTRKYLDENGIDEEEAVALIGSLIVKYWGPTNCIRCLGHNVHMFDRLFLDDLFKRHDIVLKFGNRHYDTNSAGFMTFGTWNSNELFSLVGYEDRKDHNALEDAKMALGVARTLRLITKSALGG